MGARKVLIVEDDVDFQDLLAMRLRYHGYRCIQAYSVAEGLELFHDASPDFVLLDLGFKDFSDGTDFIKCLKDESDSYHVKVPPIVVMSSLMTEELKDELSKNDVVSGCFAKPLDSTAIINEIRQHCH